MNVDKVIEAAKEIIRLADIQEQRSKDFQQLATDARKGLDRNEIERRKQQLNSVQVVDFGNAINDLRRAFKAKK